MSIQGSGKMRVKKLTRQVCVCLFVGEVVDETMGVDRDINAVDSNRRAGKVI